MKLKQKRIAANTKSMRKDSVKQKCRRDAFAIFSNQVHCTYCDRLMLCVPWHKYRERKKVEQIDNLMGWQLLSQPGAEIETF